jgi:hypothetical protein
MATTVTRSSVPGLALRIAAIFGPMALWFAHLNLSYLLVPWSCRWGHTWVLHLVTVAAALGAIGCLLLARRLWRSRPGVDLPADRPASRTGPFLGYFGFLTGGLFLLVILLAGVSNAVIDPCAA